jgi:CheY-like chemotaxis protein
MSNRPKILAVEDEEFTLDILQYYLSNAGYDVIPAQDGAIAVQKLEETPDIDVIVLDRMMPKMDGIEFLNIIKADSRFRGIPVVMQTAAALAEQVRHGLEAGADYYLTKPYDHAELLGMVNSSLVRKFDSELQDASKGFSKDKSCDEAKNRLESMVIAGYEQALEKGLSPNLALSIVLDWGAREAERLAI